MKKHQSISLAIYAFAFSLWLFYFASVAYARDCPPNDPSRADCAAAAQTAENPLVPATGTVAGTATSVVIDKLRNRKRPKPATKPPKDYGPGRTNVWDPPETEQQEKWEKEGLVWDPQELTWRPPRPGEIPPPDDAPEEPPPYQRQNPREKVPPACLGYYDDYVLLQSRLIALEGEIKFASEAQFDAQLRLNQLLAKFTLKFGWDLADTLMLADGVARLTVAIGDIMSSMLPRVLGEALDAARSAFRKASSKVSDIASELTNLTRTAGSKARLADELVDAAKSLRGTADDAAKALSEADEAAKVARAAVKEAEDALAAATTQVDKLKAEKALLEAQKAVVEGQAQVYKQWQEGYLKYLGQKPAAGIGSRFYDEAFKLEMLGHDINFAKLDIAKLRALPKPSPAQLQELANLESQLAKLYNEAAPLKKIMDDAAKAFYGVDDISKVTNEFMEQHLNNHLRKVMGDDAFARYAASSGEDLVNAANKVVEIEGKLAGVAKNLDPLLEASRKAGTQVVKVAEEAKKAQTVAQKIATESAEKAGKAAEAESKAARAVQESAEAEETITRTKSNLDGAKTEASTAEQALNTAEAAAREHIKHKFAESPDEVAKVLIEAKKDVQRIVDALKAKQAEYDETLKAMKDVKPKLDQCIYENTPIGSIQ
jgi:ABC-type transporter Mla subunit MlaD